MCCNHTILSDGNSINNIIIIEISSHACISNISHYNQFYKQKINKSTFGTIESTGILSDLKVGARNTHTSLM